MATRESKVKSPERSTKRVGPLSVVVDDEPDELLITAKKQLTLHCGASSITLTSAGKIIIRGKYIVSRSSGVQRIKGGSVQIN
jgi:hypothetical protein